MIGPRGLEPPAGLINRSKTNSLQIIFNNPRSSIKPGSASDPFMVQPSNYQITKLPLYTFVNCI